MLDLDRQLREYCDHLDAVYTTPDVDSLVGSHRVSAARPRWVAFAAALAVAVLLVAGPLVLLWVLSDTEPTPGPAVTVPSAPVTTVEVPATSSAPVTEPPTTGAVTGPTPATTTTAAPATTVATTAAPTTTTATPVPPIGEGWEPVLETRPGDTPFLAGYATYPVGDVLYVGMIGDGWYRISVNGPEPTPTKVDVPARYDPAGGFVAGGPGVVAWSNMGDDSRTDARLFVSTDGLAFDRVANGLLAGCTGERGCAGTEILSAAAAPAGRIVVLAYDKILTTGEEPCCEVVALVSDDGYEWTKHPIDLLAALPEAWQGVAEVRGPIVHVQGRWLTFATHYYADCNCFDSAFLASDDGIIWHAIDTGSRFNQTRILDLAANDMGVVAGSLRSLLWSPDGLEWTEQTIVGESRLVDVDVAAYDGGFAAVSGVCAALDCIEPHVTMWHSAGTGEWEARALRLEEAPVGGGVITGSGPYVVMSGIALTNLHAVWIWTG